MVNQQLSSGLKKFVSVPSLENLYEWIAQKVSTRQICHHNEIKVN